LLLELAGGNRLLGERRTSESLQPARQDNDVASDGFTATMVFRETSTSLTESRQPVTVEGSMRSVTAATVDALTSKDGSGLSVNKDVSHVVQGSPSHATALTRRIMLGVRQEPDVMLNGLSQLGNSVESGPPMTKTGNHVGDGINANKTQTTPRIKLRLPQRPSAHSASGFVNDSTVSPAPDVSS
jgi:hypothetical protein